MQVRIQVEVVISISNGGCSVDELCRVILPVRDEIGVRLAETAITAMQQELCLEAATKPGAVPAEVLEHSRKGDPPEHRCQGGPFVGKGWRGRERKMRTELGEIKFRVRQMMCKRCGRRFAPMLALLSMRSRRHTMGLEAVVVECVTHDSFRPGMKAVESRTGVRVPPTTAHQWWAVGPWKDVPLSEGESVETLMGDGTGFKGRGGKRGDLKVVIGFTEEGRAVGLGTSAGESWKAVMREVRRRIRAQKERPKLAVTDGERDLARHLAKLTNDSQRCTWHGGRDLGFALWQDGMKKSRRDEEVGSLRGLLGIEIPRGEWEEIPAAELEALRQALARARSGGDALAERLRASGCPKAAGYLRRFLEHAFTHVEVWLETGLALPRTTSFLEGLMGRLGRRLKKIAWNWSDEGATRMARVLLKQILEPAAWAEWVRRQLSQSERAFAAVTSIRAVQVTGFV